MCERVYKVRFFLFVIPIFVIFTFANTAAQENTEVKAIQFFNAGKFHEAEILFKKLLDDNPGSPISNYYYGASRTENGYFGEKELEYLKLAGKNITPDRLNYYLAMQYHAREDWEQALKHYNLFRQSVPESESQELGLNKKIELCYEQVNLSKATANSSGSLNAKTNVPENLSISSDTIDCSTVKLPADQDNITAFTGNTDTLGNIESVDTIIADALPPGDKNLPETTGLKPTVPLGESIQFQINNTITYLYTSHFQTTEGKSLFEKAGTLHNEQELRLKEAEELRKAYKQSRNQEERNDLASKIIDLEERYYQLEKEIINMYSESRRLENEYWEKEGTAAQKNFLSSYENIVSETKQDDLPPEPQKELIIDFIEEKTITPAKKASSDLVYKIQIGAYSKGIPAYKQKLFNKLAVIRTIDSYVDEKGVTVYTTGNLTSYEDALKMQNQVKQEGIQDARIIPFFNEKRITLEQAKEMEAKNDI